MAFEDIGHSNDARELMRKYEIGKLTTAVSLSHKILFVNGFIIQ